jgi:hypothetical protein
VHYVGKQILHFCPILPLRLDSVSANCPFPTERSNALLGGC